MTLYSNSPFVKSTKGPGRGPTGEPGDPTEITHYKSHCQEYTLTGDAMPLTATLPDGHTLDPDRKPKVYANGILQKSGIGYTYDEATDTITPITPVGSDTDPCCWQVDWQTICTTLVEAIIIEQPGTNVQTHKTTKTTQELTGEVTAIPAPTFTAPETLCPDGHCVYANGVLQKLGDQYTFDGTQIIPDPSANLGTPEDPCCWTVVWQSKCDITIPLAEPPVTVEPDECIDGLTEIPATAEANIKLIKVELDVTTDITNADITKPAGMAELAVLQIKNVGTADINWTDDTHTYCFGPGDYLCLQCCNGQLTFKP